MHVRESVQRNRQLGGCFGKCRRYGECLLKKFAGSLEQPQIAAQQTQEVDHLGIASVGRIVLLGAIEATRRVMLESQRQILVAFRNLVGVPAWMLRFSHIHSVWTSFCVCYAAPPRGQRPNGMW